MKKTTKTKALKAKTKEIKPRYVVIRSNMAGVFIGELVTLNIACRSVSLRNSIRMWNWHGASLSQVALEGHSDGEKKTCVTVERHTVFDVVECLESNDAAYRRVAANVRWRA